MESKKGFLLASETLRIIIAVICIGFLVYFLNSLYSSNKNSENLEFATNSLNQLIMDLNSKNTDIEIYNPKNWVLISWSFEGELPLKCSNVGWKDCICICKKPLAIPISGLVAYSDKCDDWGICLENSQGFKTFGKKQNPYIVIGSPSYLQVNYETSEINIK